MSGCFSSYLQKKKILSDSGCILKTLYQLYYLLTQKPYSKYQLYNLQLLIIKNIPKSNTAISESRAGIRIFVLSRFRNF